MGCTVIFLKVCVVGCFYSKHYLNQPQVLHPLSQHLTCCSVIALPLKMFAKHKRRFSIFTQGYFALALIDCFKNPSTSPSESEAKNLVEQQSDGKNWPWSEIAGIIHLVKKKREREMETRMVLCKFNNTLFQAKLLTGNF